MTLGALIAATGEANGGDALRATLPLAGRTVLDHQARAAAVLGASPVVVLADRMPDSLATALDGLARDGVPVALARDADEAADALGERAVLLIGDGVVAAPGSLERVAATGGPAVLTFPDEPGMDHWERIDAGTRWAGVALAPAPMLADTAGGLGDWDLHSTLLRRLVQDDARRLPLRADAGAPVLADTPADLHRLETRLLAAAQPPRTDWVRARLLPWIETPLVARLVGTGVTAGGLTLGALGLLILGAFFFARGWLGAGLIALLLSTPLEGAAERLAALRYKPARGVGWLPVAFPIAAAGALAALAGRLWADGAGWGAGLAAAATLAALAATREETRHAGGGAHAPWRPTHVNAIWAAVPFALGGWWLAGLLALCAWAFVSFWYEQRHAHHLPGTKIPN